MMRRFLIAAVLALGIAGCAGKQIPISGAVTLNSMYSVESAYGIALSSMRAYKALPLCLTGTTSTFINPCARRSVIVRLRAADRRAISALRDANNFIKKYPSVDASNVISAARDAVSGIRTVLNNEGI